MDTNNYKEKVPNRHPKAVTDDGIVVEILVTTEGAESQGIRRFGPDQYRIEDYPQRYFARQDSVKFC